MENPFRCDQCHFYQECLRMGSYGPHIDCPSMRMHYLDATKEVVNRAKRSKGMKIIDQRRFKKNVLFKDIPEGAVFLHGDNYETGYYIKGKVISSGEEWALDLDSGRLDRIAPNTMITLMPNAELIIKE